MSCNFSLNEYKPHLKLLNFTALNCILYKSTTELERLEKNIVDRYRGRGNTISQLHLIFNFINIMFATPSIVYPNLAIICIRLMWNTS